MGFGVIYHPVAWIVALIALVICWPLSQTFRHEKLHPLAAYLLFTSVLFLVFSLVFWTLLWCASLLIGAAALEGVGTAAVITLLSLVPAFVAAFWIVRRPQTRRMPK